MAVRLRDGDLMARLGGDEFVMVQVTAAKARDHIRQVADRVLHGLQQPVRIENHELRVGCSLGGSLWPLDHVEVELDDALELANQALYRAEHAGRNRAEFQDGAGNSA